MDGILVAGDAVHAYMPGIEAGQAVCAAGFCKEVVMARILAVDDEESILDIIRIGLGKEGHQVSTVSDPRKVDMLHLDYFDLVLLDIMMPGMDGFELVSRLREATGVPIIFLTARTDQADVVRGLGLGADDYLTKPFHLDELRARVDAHLRREGRARSQVLTLGEFRFDMSAKELTCGDRAMNLTPTEYAICEFLAVNRGHVYSKEQIHREVSGLDPRGEAAAVATHIGNIRAKFQEVGMAPIHTRWGVGYLWV